MVRQCFLTGELIFLAEERANRPQSFKSSGIQATSQSACPFCPENSFMTPKEVFISENKKIKIVPNKYPFVSRNDPDHYGIHEVLIDTDKHEEKLRDFSDSHIGSVISVLKERVISLYKDDKIIYVQIFKNDGVNAGASQAHSHWQLAALSILPPRYTETNNILKKYVEENGKCYFCHLSESLDSQIIEENEYFTAYVPTDAKFPYEMYIIPKSHISSVIYFNKTQCDLLGKIIKNCVKRLTSLMGDISYNICFFSSPSPKGGGDYEKHIHFYAQIIPRIGNIAGFEFSTGCYVNSVFPEKAAEILKNISV